MMTNTAADASVQRMALNNPISTSDSNVIQAPDGLGGMLSIHIQKISSTAHFGIPLDLKKIAFKCRNTQFNPRRYGALVMRLRELEATGIMFASGKLIVTEVDSIQKAELACIEFRNVIEKIEFKPKEFGAMDFKIKNIMGTADMGFPLRLEELSYAHSDFATYEPEVFPGLIYRLDRTEVVFLLFSSGKMVITGDKKGSDLKSALTKLYPVLVEYKKKSYLPNGVAVVPTANHGTSNSTRTNGIPHGMDLS
eukprot:scaffold20012_cov179-Cylindrotheca_fusiformis.AAC.5